LQALAKRERKVPLAMGCFASTATRPEHSHRAAPVVTQGTDTAMSRSGVSGSFSDGQGMSDEIPQGGTPAVEVPQGKKLTIPSLTRRCYSGDNLQAWSSEAEGATEERVPPLPRLLGRSATAAEVSNTADAVTVEPPPAEVGRMTASSAEAGLAMKTSMSSQTEIQTTTPIHFKDVAGSYTVDTMVTFAPASSFAPTPSSTVSSGQSGTEASSSPRARSFGCMTPSDLNLIGDELSGTVVGFENENFVLVDVDTPCKRRARLMVVNKEEPWLKIGDRLDGLEVILVDLGKSLIEVVWRR